MLSKKNRLSRAQFSDYFKIGKRYHTANFTLIHYPFLILLASVVVGKKVHKDAVDRNRLRRRVYAALRSVIGDLQQGGIFIIIAKPTARHIERKAIKLELAELLAQINKSR